MGDLLDKVVATAKHLLAWIERHHDLASWLEAGAVFATVFVALRIAGADRRERRQERRLRAQGLAVLLHTQLVGFQGTLERAIEGNSYEQVQPPPKLVEYADQLYLLGTAGGALLQMISAVNAHNDFVTGASRFQRIIDHELKEGCRRSLVLALESCNEAIAGLDQLIRARRT